MTQIKDRFVLPLTNLCREILRKHYSFDKPLTRIADTADDAFVIPLQRTKAHQISPAGGVLPSNRLMGVCHWMGLHFHDWIDYNGVAFSLGANRVTRMGSHICGISGVSKFRQVGIWGIFAQK